MKFEHGVFEFHGNLRFESKRADARPVITSMRLAKVDLKLIALYVLYLGQHRYRLSDGMEAVPLKALLSYS